MSQQARAQLICTTGAVETRRQQTRDWGGKLERKGKKTTGKQKGMKDAFPLFFFLSSQEARQRRPSTRGLRQCNLSASEATADTFTHCVMKKHISALPVESPHISAVSPCN